MSISEHLGYPDDSLEPTVVPSRSAMVTQITTRLTQIDQELVQSYTDSKAEQVADLKLNYGRQIALLSIEGTKLLSQLSVITGLAINYNKYLGYKPTSTSPLSIVSYH